MIEIDYIKERMQGSRLAKDIVYLDRVDSTNTYAKEQVKAGAGEGLVVIAGTQTGGRGRIGRSWDSGEAGESLALSFVIKPNLPIEKIPMLTLAVAMAVRKCITSTSVQIKWPNDILYNGKKLCGILNELVMRDGENFVVVGVGVNVAQMDFGEDNDKRTSLYKEGIVAPIDTLAILILKNFENIFAQIEKDGSLESIKDEYISLMAGAGEYVRVLDSASVGGDIAKAKLVKEGVCVGINDRGQLLVEDTDGVTAFDGGEISVRF